MLNDAFWVGPFTNEQAKKSNRFLELFFESICVIIPAG